MLKAQIERIPLIEGLLIFIMLVAFGSFIYGYGICAEAADKYAAHKGYKNYLYIYSILNILGLSILFLLKNKKASRA